MAEDQSAGRSWGRKFSDACHGVGLGVRGQSSFAVHIVCLVLVILCGIVFGVSRIEWCILCLCITVVLGAEMFNSALEFLAKAITTEQNDDIGAALDIASAAVLLCAAGAAVTGLIVFLFRLGVWLAWWSV